MSASAALLQTPASRSPQASAVVLRRKCACGGSDHECEECRKKGLQRQASGGTAPAHAPALVHDVLASAGRPLDAASRSFMQARFGHDFAGVRIHADERAAESARLVRATAYTVGDHIVLGRSAPPAGTAAGRQLLAHELAHTIQQRGAGAPGSGPLTVGREDDPCEREAEALAAGVVSEQPAVAGVGAITVAPRIQRVVDVTPAAAASDVLSHFETLCPGQFIASGSQIQPKPNACLSSSNNSCQCACDTASDASRTYKIDVQPAAGSTAQDTLYDGSVAAVPGTSVYPQTSVQGNTTTINMAASAGSSIEFGFFDPKGRPVWYDNWRILAHELCGHGRLLQSQGGSTGCRPAHNSTIDTENTIAAEHGGAARGHYSDTRQGEAFWNPVGDRSKVAFRQCNGLHYEAP